jgi:hypothetical protein
MPFGKNTALSLFCLLCLVLSTSPARATDVERREFSILIDGKDSGFSRMVITVQDDGTTVMQGSCSVKFTKLLFTFSYQIEASEWWKDGKLIGLKSKSTENSKKNDVSGSMDGAQLKVRANGKDVVLRSDAWTTSYWKLADAKYHNKPVPLVDPEDGKEYNGQLQFVAQEQITINKTPQTCYHFKVTGGPQPTDLWYDRFHRLVRQEFTEQGHKIIVQLNQIVR